MPFIAAFIVAMLLGLILTFQFDLHDWEAFLAGVFAGVIAYGIYLFDFYRNK